MYLMCVDNNNVEIFSVIQSVDKVKNFMLNTAKMCCILDGRVWEDMLFVDKILYVRDVVNLVKVYKLGKG